jgi:hypothetical protein
MDPVILFLSAQPTGQLFGIDALHLLFRDNTKDPQGESRGIRQKSGLKGYEASKKNQEIRSRLLCPRTGQFKCR